MSNQQKQEPMARTVETCSLSLSKAQAPRQLLDNRKAKVVTSGNVKAVRVTAAENPEDGTKLEPNSDKSRLPTPALIIPDPIAEKQSIDASQKKKIVKIENPTLMAFNFNQDATCKHSGANDGLA